MHTHVPYNSFNWLWYVPKYKVQTQPTISNITEDTSSQLQLFYRKIHNVGKYNTNTNTRAVCFSTPIHIILHLSNWTGLIKISGHVEILLIIIQSITLRGWRYVPTSKVQNTTVVLHVIFPLWTNFITIYTHTDTMHTNVQYIITASIDAFVSA
jgi:hypothetical protein